MPILEVVVALALVIVALRGISAIQERWRRKEANRLAMTRLHLRAYQSEDPDFIDDVLRLDRSMTTEDRAKLIERRDNLLIQQHARRPIQ